MLGVNVVLGLLVLAAFWFIGNSLDQTRSGIELSDGNLRVVSAVCDGEQLEAVRLFRVVDDAEVPTQEILWEVEGSTELPAQFVIGALLPGMQTLVPFSNDIEPSDELVFRLRTSQLQSVDAFGFTLADLENGAVASVPELSSDSVSEFRDRAASETACN